MKSLAYIRWAEPPLWMVTLANLLPLWLLSFAILPGSLGLGMPAFLLALAVSIVLLRLHWFTADLVLYSFVPFFIFMFIFDEMAARYEAPFILLCTLFLAAGIAGYRLSLHKGSLGFGWLTLLVFFIGTWVLASHANQNYWQVVGGLGFGCAPGMDGCPPLTGNETPWWRLFFGL